jgi:hypothetical protein
MRRLMDPWKPFELFQNAIGAFSPNAHNPEPSRLQIWLGLPYYLDLKHSTSPPLLELSAHGEMRF